MPNEDGGETREEYEERIRIVTSNQIFGDTPTDSTIGDVVVPTHDEEGGNVDQAVVEDAAANGNEDAQNVSPEGAKRQASQFDSEQVDADAEDHSEDTGSDLWAGNTDNASLDETPEETTEDSTEESDEDPDGDGPELSREDKIAAINNASSVEEVDSLVGDDKRATVTRAADAKRTELSA